LAIYALDEISVRPQMRETFEASYRKVYAPMAVERGMRLEHAWLTPPVPLKDAPNSLIFIWSVPDAPAWWRMRHGAYDPKVSAFWRDAAPMILDRRRVFLGPLPQFLGHADD
jgi:hypothetical protein